MPNLAILKAVVMLAEGWCFCAVSAPTGLGTRVRVWKANASPTDRQVATEAAKINARVIDLLPLLLLLLLLLLLPRVLVAAKGNKGKLIVIVCSTVRT